MKLIRNNWTSASGSRAQELVDLVLLFSLANLYSSEVVIKTRGLQLDH